jgi:hypothetical protein
MLMLQNNLHAPADSGMNVVPSQRPVEVELDLLRLDYGFDPEMAVGNLHEDQKLVRQDIYCTPHHPSHHWAWVSSDFGRYIKHGGWVMCAIADMVSQLKKSAFPTLFMMAMDYISTSRLHAM